MAFDIGAGIYWRPEEGGFLWGMSNPAEEPGPGRAIDWAYLRKMERRLNTLLPATKGLGMKKVWSATIEYTPDHLPLLGPLVRRDGAEVDGVTIASACGHGMMWGPAVSKIATDLALDGTHERGRARRRHAHGSLRRARQLAVRRPGRVAVPGARRRLTLTAGARGRSACA